jgi:hypothetical protein
MGFFLRQLIRSFIYTARSFVYKSVGFLLRREAKEAPVDEGEGELWLPPVGEGAEAGGVLERAIAAAVGKAAAEGVEIGTVKLGDALPEAAAEGVEIGTVKLGDVESLVSVPVGDGQDEWQVRGREWGPPLGTALKWGFVALAAAVVLLLVWVYVQRTRVTDFQAIVVEGPAAGEETAAAVPDPKAVPTPPPPPVIEKVEPPAVKVAGDVEGLMAEAEKHFSDGYLSKAAKICEEIIEREPREHRAYFLLGDIYFERGDFERAKVMYEMAGGAGGE